MNKYDERPTVVDPTSARQRGAALMEQWEAEDAMKGVTADDFATPGENVMIVPVMELKRGDTIVKLPSDTWHTCSMYVRSVGKALDVPEHYTVKALNELSMSTTAEPCTLTLHGDHLVTIERPDYNL